MKQTLKTGLKKVCILLRAVKMHFMIGRIFMNQESKVINVHLEKRENKDYLVFDFEETAEVCLNNDESQNDLKSIFVKLLTEITKHPIELHFLFFRHLPLCLLSPVQSTLR